MAPKTRIAGVRYRGEAERDRFLASGDWLPITAGGALRNVAERDPAGVAAIGHDGVLAFRELDDSTESVAAALLEAGLEPGDRALFQVGSVKEFFVCLFACFKAGVVPVCTLPQFREIEVGTFGERTGAKAFFVQADVNPNFDQVGFARKMTRQLDKLRHIIVVRGEAATGELSLADMAARHNRLAARRIVQPHDPSFEDVAVLQMSGGSTGLPKLIPRMHAEYLGAAAALSRRYELSGEDRALWALPLVHNAGMLFVVMPMALEGRAVAVLPRFEPVEFLTSVATHKVTFTGSIGPIAPRLLELDNVKSYDLSTLRQFFALSRADAVEAHLGITGGQMFGTTEGLVMASAPSESRRSRHETLGRPVSDLDEIRLVEIDGSTDVAEGAVGELYFRGPHVFTGYVGDDAANAASFTPDGFFKSGDLLRCMRVDGRLCYIFEGRLKDNINRGGEKIGAEEVEQVLAKHPAISDVRVVAMPDKVFGEKACAFIIPRPSHEVPGLPEISQFLTSMGLAKYKIPERIEPLDIFPTTRVGKVDKAQLRQVIAEKLAAQEAAAS